MHIFIILSNSTISTSLAEIEGCGSGVPTGTAGSLVVPVTEN